MSDEEDSDDWFESGISDEDDGEDAFGDESDGTDDEDPFADDDDGAFDEEAAFGDDGDDPFGGDADAEDPFAGGDDDSLFDDDFGAAFDAGGGGDEFDEEYETDIPRIDTGVEGLDEMIQGGVPERSLMVVMGSAGTGKTTFGLQFLHRGIQDGERAVYITLEETEQAILDAASEKGWPFEEYVEEDRLVIVDLDPIEMANSLSSIRSDLPRLVDDFGAERLVLDSVSLLEMMYDDQAERRTEVFDFTKALKRAGVSTMLTSEASEGNPYASRHGIIEYLTDAVFVLQYVRSEFQETRLAVEIQKIRNANHSRETKPYEITGEGISVYQQANIF